jgi:tetratricopeptide (TPR) repeat protein
MPRPGTNIQRAIETAASVFDPADASSKALVLVTDGDNLDGDLGLATRVAVANNIRIYAVGVGTPEGSTIPETGASGTSYKKDKDDKIVVSRLAERLLLVMAKATDGRYFRSESINLDNLVAALDQVHKKSFGGGDYLEYEERYQGFLLAGFILLYMGLLASDRRGAWFTGLRGPRWPRLPRGAAARGARQAALVAGALLALVSPARADVGSLMRKGDALERQGKYDLAVKAYQDALVLEPDNVRIHYDIGRALSRMNQQPEAIEHFQLGLLARQKPVRANSVYNMGNCQYKQGKLDEAIAMYTQALLLRPKDLEAKQNLEFCLKKKSESQQKPDSTGKPPPQQQPQQQQQPQPQQAQQQKGAISKEQANRMLQALQGKERENRKQQPKPPQQSPAGGKDW